MHVLNLLEVRSFVTTIFDCSLTYTPMGLVINYKLDSNQIVFEQSWYDPLPPPPPQIGPCRKPFSQKLQT